MDFDRMLVAAELGRNRLRKDSPPESIRKWAKDGQSQTDGPVFVYGITEFVVGLLSRSPIIQRHERDYFLKFWFQVLLLFE
jgi:hypothetical protein